MLLNYIRSHRPSYIITLAVVGITLWLQPIVSDFGVVHENQIQYMPLFYLLNHYLGQLPFVFPVLGMFLVFFMSFIALRINEKYLIIETRSYLLALMLIVLQSSLLVFNQLNPVLIATLFVLLSIDKLFETYKDESRVTNFFDTGLLLSIGSLFYLDIIFLLVPIWIGMMILDSFKLRYWTLTLIGALLPYFLAGSYYYVTDDWVWFTNTVSNNFIPSKGQFILNIAHFVFFLFVFLLVILSSFHVINLLRISKISSRKYMKILFVFFISILVLYQFLAPTSSELFQVLSIPLAFLLSLYILSIRNHWTGNIVLFVFIILIIFIQLFPFFEDIIPGISIF